MRVVEKNDDYESEMGYGSINMEEIISKLVSIYSGMGFDGVVSNKECAMMSGTSRNDLSRCTSDSNIPQK